MPTMTAEKPKREKVTFEIPERYRRALAIYAAKHGLNIGDVVIEMTDAMLAPYLAEADKGIAAGTSTPKTRRGRKPNPPSAD